MIIGSGRAPGKVILFGEHAVVYGRPALAVPVTQVQAEAVVEPGEPGAGLTIVAADLGETISVRDAPADHPLAAAARLTLVKFGLDDPDWRVTVRSTIPIASGMGSGAAVSAAIVRALAEAANSKWQIRQTRQARRIGKLAVCSLQFADPFPRWSTRSSASITARPAASTTPSSSTASRSISCAGRRRRRSLSAGRLRWLSPTPAFTARPRSRWGTCGGRGSERRTRFESLFDRIAMVVEAARSAIAAGEPERLGPLMDENHALLQEIGVSSPELDALVAAARSAGALGAKLSGGGRGGNMIALVTEATASQVADALRAAGAVNVIVSTVRTSDT